MPDAIGQFEKAKYLSLETFRKTGAGVRTPVWFALELRAEAGNEGNEFSAVFYIYSAPDAGKVKRIRNNPKARIAPCTLRGEIRGAWIEGRARLCDQDEAAHGQKLLRQKYGLIKIIGDFFSTKIMRRKQAVIAIQV